MAFKGGEPSMAVRHWTAVFPSPDGVMAFKDILHSLLRLKTMFPSPDGVMAFKVCKHRGNRWGYWPQFPSPDGVMAFKGSENQYFCFYGHRFRPLMGLWPLKFAGWFEWDRQWSRFRPLMGLWPLKLIKRRIGRGMSEFPSPDGVMAFKDYQKDGKWFS